MLYYKELNFHVTHSQNGNFTITILDREIFEFNTINFINESIKTFLKSHFNLQNNIIAKYIIHKKL